jgi:branched-chain amino acid transport system substrate-binding protein
MPGKIFINYRRDDDRSAAARVRDRLAAVFGKSNVFMDVDNLLAGQRFDRELEKALAETDVFLAVIGRHWMELFAARRASGERDFVREEIAGALARGLVVIPVLLERAPLPKAAELPEDIRELVMHHKHDVTHEHFGREIDDLIAAIRAVRRSSRPRTPLPRGLVVGVPAVMVAVTALVGTYLAGVSIPWPSATRVGTEPERHPAVAAVQQPTVSSGAFQPTADAASKSKTEPVPSAASNQRVAVKIGVLTDMSSFYSDVGGLGSVAAAKLAIADFNAEHKDINVELVSGDHQNKPEVGSALARKWFDVDKVDMIVDVPNSGVAFAVSQVANQENKVFIASGAASTDLTGAKCNANTVHWTYDSRMLANSTAGGMVKTGGDTWFFITADYAFGQAFQRDAASVVTANGGKVLGDVLHPLGTSDFSAYLLQAQASRAKVIGLADGGNDTINEIKQAAEFGVAKGGQNLAGLLVFASDVAALGLNTAQGVVLSEAWYWDMNDANRAWTKRWQKERPGKIPTMVHAGVYSGIIHYLKAVEALRNAADGKAVVAKMKAIPTDDILFGRGSIRADGRTLHPAYLFEVKKPTESNHPGDFYKVRATITAEEAFRPLGGSTCPLVGG